MTTVVEHLVENQGPRHAVSKSTAMQSKFVENVKQRKVGSATPSVGSGINRRPYFILCSSRSGSTLLRLRLNMHKDIACPPETDLPHALSALDFVWNAVGGLDAGEHSMVRRKLRSVVSQPLDLYTRSRGKTIWCEKTPSNIDGADILLRTFPRAHFICLYRHPMDVISSGIEACRWGFGAYGFDPYVRANPENVVLALARYWYEKSLRELQFETEHPSKCFRIHYETLVFHPKATLTSLIDWMGLSWDNSVLDATVAPIADLGHGDHKAIYSQHISTESVGKGATVPVMMIPPRILEGINALCSRLGYPAISDSWNRSVGPFLDDLTGRPAEVDKSYGVVVQILREGLKHTEYLGRPAEGGRGFCLRLIFENVSRDSSEWMLDFENQSIQPACSAGRADDEQTDFVIVAASQIYLSISQSLVNTGELLRAGSLRISSLQIDSRVELQSFIFDFETLLRLGFERVSRIQRGVTEPAESFSSSEL